jgi:hypothetical protein
VLQGFVMRRALVALVVVATLAACGDDDGSGGAIEENVVRPGITAMEQASALACNSDAEALRVAIESYTVLEGEPPPDEAALVAGEYMRTESELHDVVDGQVVPVDPGCGGTGSIPSSAPPVTEVGDIVTSTEPPLTPDQMMAELTPEEIAQVGGEACARELVTIFTAGQSYVAERGTEPENLDDLVQGGYLETPITLWVVEDDTLRPAEGSGCVDLETADLMTQCTGDARTLVIAREAHFAQNPGGSEPSQADLLAEGLLAVPSEVVDLANGVVVAVPGGPCEGVDLGV